MIKHFKKDKVKAHFEWLCYSTRSGRAASTLGPHGCNIHHRSIVSSREADQWMPAGRPDTVARLPGKARHAMFTAMEVALGPANAAAVGNLRVTVGEFIV